MDLLSVPFLLSPTPMSPPTRITPTLVKLWTVATLGLLILGITIVLLLSAVKASCSSVGLSFPGGTSTTTARPHKHLLRTRPGSTTLLRSLFVYTRQATWSGIAQMEA